MEKFILVCEIYTTLNEAQKLKKFNKKILTTSKTLGIIEITISYVHSRLVSFGNIF